MIKQGLLFQDFAQVGAKTKQAANFKWGYPPPLQIGFPYILIWDCSFLSPPPSPQPWGESTPWSPEINPVKFI